MTDNRYFEHLKNTAIDFTESHRLHLGIKGVNISGELLRIIYEQGDWSQFWHELTSKLPKDARIIKGFDGQPLILQGVSSGVYCDYLFIVFGSREWELLKDGDFIPEFNLNSLQNLTTLKPTSIWSRIYVRIAEKFVKWFPNWVRY